jgi:pilus assembly protein Flp/PilA
MKALKNFLWREDGPAAVEYAVLVAMILLVCIGAITLVGGGTANFWGNNRDELNAHLP